MIIWLIVFLVFGVVFDFVDIVELVVILTKSALLTGV